MQISPIKITRFLFVITTALFIAHILTLFLEYLPDEYNNLKKFANHYFNVNTEANIPNFFSALILFIASCLLIFIYRTTKKHDKKNKNYWLGLALIFLFLSVDEAVQIHELFIFFFDSRISNLPDFLRLAWVIPYSAFLLIVTVLFIKFVLGLPKKSRDLFFLSGFIYVFGALALELVEAHLASNKSIMYTLCYTLQELLEMVGVVIFIHALLAYIAPDNKKIVITTE